MKSVITDTGRIVFEGVKDFSPSLTFDCGQCFRFDVLADGFLTLRCNSAK